MAKTSFIFQSVIVYLLTLVIYQSNSFDFSSSTIELNIEIAEELPVGTEVADLAADAGVDSSRDALEFEIVSGSFYQYFIIGGNTTVTSRTGGHLIVDRTLDRDVICRHRSANTTCIIN